MRDNEELEELDEEGSFFDELGETDYAFVVSAQGELKSVFVPSSEGEVPENINKVLEIFGINEVGGQRTLH